MNIEKIREALEECRNQIEVPGTTYQNVLAALAELDKAPVGLTVRSITLAGEQPDPAGEIKVLVEFSDGSAVEAIRTCANSIYHMVTWSGLMEERSRIAVAIESKKAKP